MIGYLQRQVIEFVKRDGYISESKVKIMYGSHDKAKSTLLKLEALGLIKFKGNGRWVKAGQFSEVYEALE